MNTRETQLVAKTKLEMLTKIMPKKLVLMTQHCQQVIDNTSPDPSVQLIALYQLMNEVYEFIDNFTPCHKGCNHCCCYEVSLSEIEIRFIEDNTGIKRKQDRENIKLGKGVFHGKPCPFLTEEGCAVYPVRPYVCRRHVTVAPDNTCCDTNLSQTVLLPVVRFEQIDEVFGEICKRYGHTERIDIRQVFEPLSR
ncbi:hypothetical protein CS022_08185 [Veronia nyctiphanis]|uniref:YkgJ family cysteine cluster protein n=1 Tax=Veronia nyctiphanis TaxID=1278244 RepID=A0A4Q0YSN8_9GAMM|nr:YkgJ family cysteine cluster protein [Veronia nyctiphanis]RXJ73705.1 hypothetical protein CS022_08185 [Veronia nyctiphanis]